ncbi:MAG: SIMPL domain-containing protein [Rickettsiales bacterium]|jgi:uncharacterized protein YggE|nr:SIMPL domain-containing protein [Rickettsiales bacterium]
MAIFTQNFKRAVPWGVLFLILIGVIIFQWWGVFAGKNSRVINVIGECTTNVSRDITAITLRIETLAPTGGESIAMARTTYNNVSILLDLYPNVEKQTTRWESYEKTEWSNNAQKSLGVQTIISVDVTSKTMGDIEKILRDAERLNNVYPENLRMFASDAAKKPAIEACLNDAVQNARADAERIAASEGASLGQMISAQYGTDGGGKPAPILMRAVALDSVANAGLMTTDEKISVTVSASFKLK